MSLASPDNQTAQKIAILRDRAHMLAQARQFFAERNTLEVDCPLLSPRASVDAHIDLIEAHPTPNETRYLHSSPEYGMKRLLSECMSDIYQISHVFRKGEQSRKHNPEFTMAEWYRRISYPEMIQETADFIRLFLGDLPLEIISYQEAFLTHCNLHPHRATTQELLQFIHSQNIPLYPDWDQEGKDALLNIILGSCIEPNLGNNTLTVLKEYPASQCALARTQKINGFDVAERFEIYYQGVELANGYHELTDASEQHRRFLEANQKRLALGKEELPIDTYFLSALEKGLPDCCGVAVGFDRLMMLRHNISDIADVIPFAWDIA